MFVYLENSNKEASIDFLFILNRKSLLVDKNIICKSYMKNSTASQLRCPG